MNKEKLMAEDKHNFSNFIQSAILALGLSVTANNAMAQESLSPEQKPTNTIESPDGKETKLEKLCKDREKIAIKAIRKKLDKKCGSKLSSHTPDLE
jgi:hypothetical protein